MVAGGVEEQTMHKRIGFGSLMVGAPTLMLGAAVLHPPHSIENGVRYQGASHDYSIGMAGIAGSLAYTVPLVLAAPALLAGFGSVGVRVLGSPGVALPQAGLV
jgi:hypothetical protein